MSFKLVSCWTYPTCTIIFDFTEHSEGKFTGLAEMVEVHDHADIVYLCMVREGKYFIKTRTIKSCT